MHYKSIIGSSLYSLQKQRLKTKKTTILKISTSKVKKTT